LNQNHFPRNLIYRGVARREESESFSIGRFTEAVHYVMIQGIFIMLMGKHAPSKSYRHPLFGSVTRLPEPELTEIVALYRTTGDIKLAHKIAVSHIPLALAIVGQYLSRCPTHGDELVSVALQRMVQAINHAPQRLYDNNITPYLRGHLHSYIHEATCKIMQESMTSVSYQDNARLELTPHCYDEATGDALIDEWRSLGLTRREAAIALLRYEGFKQAEIAAMYNMTASNVCTIIHGIKGKLVPQL